MIKGLEGIKGIDWYVKEGEHITGKYADQKGNKVTLAVIDLPSDIAGCIIIVQSKAGWSECKLLKREEEAEFTKICRDLLPDIEAYSYYPAEGWNYFPKNWHLPWREDN